MSSTATRIHHVYIVDDSAPIRERLMDALGKIDGATVVGHAASAPQAVVDILALRPDTVLLDLELQGSHGLDVLRAVHPQMPEVTFVVLTNHSEPQYRRACTHAGASYFLDKATEFDLVREVVARIATRH
jgi:DNA-binding NarL/FixJ family response regulator